MLVLPKRFYFAILLLLFVGFGLQLKAEVILSNGQTLYVPVYSKILVGGRGNFLELSAMLSICNTDMHHKIILESLAFYDNDGKFIAEYLEEPLVLNPLASHHIFLKESENKGGIGANFIVRWRSVKPVNPPLAECTMIGTKSGQGISFTSVGHEITTDNR